MVPVIVTLVPPAGGPLFGEIDVTVGAAIKVNWSAALVALVPPAAVTVTSTVPVPVVGVCARICVEFKTVLSGDDKFPNLTAVTPVKFVPVITTKQVPPAAQLF